MDTFIFQAFFALFFSVIGCVLALATWFGFDRKLAGPQFWFWGFFIYLCAVVLTLLGYGLSLTHYTQVPILALETMANWLQYLGFKAVLEPQKRSSLAKTWLPMLILGMTASAFSISVGSQNVTALIENGLSASIMVLILIKLRAHRHEVKQTLQGFIFAMIGLLTFFFLVAVAYFAAGLVISGLKAPMPQIHLFFGPFKWLLGLVLLAFTEGMLISGLLLKEQAVALKESRIQHKALRRMNAELAEFQKDMLGAMAEAFESRTQETAAHVNRVAEFTRQILERLGESPERAQFVADASRLHDIGKSAIPDSILTKTGSLSEEEWVTMRQHTLYGFHILSQSRNPFFQLAATIAVEHHEHWDGSGYPARKAGTDISAEARAVAVADNFDALVSRRTYKRAWSVEEAKAWLLKHSGSLYDPAAVEAFLSLDLREQELFEPASVEIVS